MKFPGFCSGTYQSESINVDCQRSMNLYPESNNATSASPVALYQRAGKVQFTDLGTGPVGGLFRYEPAGSPNSRIFAVATQFTELFGDGTFHNYAFVTTSLPVTMAANNTNQVLICTGGNLWLFSTTTNTATQVATGLGVQFASVGFLNGFFLALQANSQTVWYSAVEDGTSWPALNFFAVNQYADNVHAMIIDHGLIWLFGLKQTAVYYNTTDFYNPFLPATSQVIEIGIFPPYSLVKLDNSIFWIAFDERGLSVAYKAYGYTPQRVSTHAIEAEWNKYGSAIGDAIGYTYQENGHQFWVLYMQTVNKTWVYDTATQLWHERSFWTGSQEVADRGRCHVYAFGKHLIGDTQSGKIWNASTSITNDFGNPIVRYRRAPHITAERQRMFHKSLQLDIETGQGPTFTDGNQIVGPRSIVLQDPVSLSYWTLTMNGSYVYQTTMGGSGTSAIVILQDSGDPTKSWQLGVNVIGQLTLIPAVTWGQYQFLMTTTAGTQGFMQVTNGWLQAGPGAGAGLGAPLNRGPLVYLRWSDDSGHTWKSQQFRDAGAIGEFKKRLVWHRLGRSRDRVYEVGTSEDFSFRLVDSYLWVEKAQQGPTYA